MGLVAARFDPSFGLQFGQIVSEPVEATLPEGAVALGPFGDVLQRSGLQPAGPPLRLVTARDQAGALQHLGGASRSPRLMSKGAASSLTVVSPCASRARMARRVGSARAEKVVLSWSMNLTDAVVNYRVK